MNWLEIFKELGFPIGVAVVSLASIWSILVLLFRRHLRLVDRLETALESLVSAQTEQNHSIELLEHEMKECRRQLQGRKDP